MTGSDDWLDRLIAEFEKEDPEAVREAREWARSVRPEDIQIRRVTMTTQKPTAKQAASGGVAMAVAVVLAWAAGQAGIDVPAEITAAVAVIIGWVGSKVGG
jgi:hypothetical protein